MSEPTIIEVIEDALRERGWQSRGRDVWELPGLGRPFTLYDAVTAEWLREVAAGIGIVYPERRDAASLPSSPSS